jgi:TRAP-type C4-dicarboxylate transport system permease small subunit
LSRYITINKWLHKFDVITASIARKASAVGAFVVLLMMTLVVADVFLRTFFNLPIKGSTELIEMSLIIPIFLSMGYIQYRKANISIDLFIRRLSPSVRNFISRLSYPISLGIVALMTWRAFVHFRYFIDESNSTAVLGIPFAPFQLFMGIGLFLLCLVLFFDFLHSLFKSKENKY